MSSFTRQQINTIRAAVRHYQQHQISITSPQYDEYEVILKLLEEYKDDDNDD